MNTDLVLAIQRRRRLARQEGAAVSEEVLQAAADLATVEALRAELARLRDAQARETAVQARNEARWRGALTAAQAAVEEERELRAQAEREVLAAQALLDGQKRATVALERELREAIAGLLRERDALRADNAALRACLADTLGFAWSEYRLDWLKPVADVRRRANELIEPPPPPPPAAPIGHCARCGGELNNVSPGFSIVAGGAAVCADCLGPGEEVTRARSL